MQDAAHPPFAELLRRARRDAGLTQEELAERAGLSVRAISDLERGINRTPRQDTLDLLAEAFDLPPDERRRWEQERRRAARPPRDGHIRSPSRAAPALPIPPPLLVGRDRELRLLGDMLDDMLAGHGRLTLLSGEAGIGKTAVAGALARQTSAAGALVLVGHCYDLMTTPPYGPWLEALRGWAPPPGLPVLPATLRDDAGIARLSGQPALFAAVVEFLRTLATHHPLLLILEDLHWADPASLELLRFVGRHIGDVPLLLVGTYRSDELHRRHPLTPVLPALVRETDATRIELPRLADSEVADLTASRYGLAGGEQGRLVEHVQQHAEGLVLYVCELLRTLEEEAVLRRDETGAWVLGDLGTLRVPRLVREVIEARVARLPEATQAALAVAAVIGQDVPLDVWARVTDTGEDALLDVADEAMRARLLVATPEGLGVRFAHALVREALYGGVLPLRRRVWHRATAEALLDGSEPDPDVVATHLRRAGDPRAAQWLIRAGERAAARYDWAGAAERFEAALELTTDPRWRGWLLYRIGWLLRYTDPARGIRFLTEAQAAAEQAHDSMLHAFALTDAGVVLCLGHESRRGLALIREGTTLIDRLAPEDAHNVANFASHLDVGTTPGGIAAQGDAVRWNPRRGTYALWLAQNGRLAEAQAIGEPYAHEVESLIPGTALFASPFAITGQAADVWQGLGLVYGFTSRPDDADTALTHARALYTRNQHHSQVALMASYRLIFVALPFRTTDLALRRRLLDEAETVVAHAHVWRSGQLHVLFVEGDWAKARTLGEEMFASPGWGYGIGCNGALARHQGRDDVAWEMIQRGLPNGPASEPDRTPFAYGSGLQRVAAELALDTGDLALAATWIAAHQRWLDQSGATVFRPHHAMLCARYERGADHLDHAIAHAACALELASTPAQPLVLIATRRLLGELLTTTGQYPETERHLHEALALADACAAPFERALTLLALAEFRLAQRQGDQARLAALEARAICEPLGAKPTLDRLDDFLRRLGPSTLVSA